MNQNPLPLPAEPAAAAAEGERRSLERRNEDRRKLERLGIRGLVAILIALVATVLAIVAVWRQAGINTRLEDLQREQQALAGGTLLLRNELTKLAQQTAANVRRSEELAGLAAQFAELNASVESLRERAESGQRTLLRDEARFLLEMANRRLVLERDVAGALSAMQAADERLAEVRDPRLAGVRRRVAVEIQSLRSFPQPDLAAIAVRLAAAEDLAADLPVLGAVTDTYEPPDEVGGMAPGFARAWRVVKTSISGMVSIRRIGEDAVELVSLEEQGVRRHHLQLLLFSARLAALRGDQEGFRATVSNAHSWLTRLFDPHDARVTQLARDLDSLGQLDLAPPLPDTSASLKLLDRLEPRAAGSP